MRDMKVVGLPFLEITMDEHSAEAGLLTRVESFVEMFRRKQKKLEMEGEKKKYYKNFMNERSFNILTFF
ncbi:MAG: hypothetical protein ACFFB9_05485 [Promethearchaeota archaeon]